MVYHFRHGHIASVCVSPCDSGPAQCCQHAQSHADSAETARALHQVSHVGKPNGRLALPHLSLWFENVVCVFKQIVESDVMVMNCEC